MDPQTFTVTATVWLYPGMDAWHFVSISKNTSQDIKRNYGHLARGFKSLPVTVVVGATTFNTSIFPDKKSNGYLLPLKKSVRQAEDIQVGDTISLKLTVKS